MINLEQILSYILEAIGLFEKVEEGQFIVPSTPPTQGWSKDLVDCHPTLRKAFPIVQAQFESQNPGYTLKLDYTYRSPALQFQLFQEGRQLENGSWIVVDQDKVVTDLDGTLHKSAHNLFPSQAFDCLIVKDNVILWAEDNSPQIELYKKLGQLFVDQGLISGALWKYTWHDWDHTQISYNF
jgi:hypothetical protein